MRLLGFPKTRAGTNSSKTLEPLCVDPCAEYLLRAGGYCKLLHDAGHWSTDAVSAAKNIMREEMAFVPAGPVKLTNIAATDGPMDTVGMLELDEASFFVDRHSVTNAQFKRFVDADAYRDASFWPAEIQPYVFQFCDASGAPGPASWDGGTYAPEKREHPVVGISWHEANAFANWVGKDLPTSSQWQRAGTWWNPNARYPWGECFEEDHANTYVAGLGDTTHVGAFADSATPNGVLQLVGNVWEWVNTSFSAIEFEGQILSIGDVLGEIRGGAFDTYFASQATCTFRSGLPLLTRSHNVGFRCVASAHILSGSIEDGILEERS